MLNTLILACLACSLGAQSSVLVPTYVLPPSSMLQSARDQRSLPATRTLARLAGGHLKLHTISNTTGKGSDKGADHAKNTFAFVDKDTKSYDDKFAGIIVKTEGQNVGWNQGQWDDGMLMSSAGNGKEKKQKQEDDEDKKTLADQVAEGKYGLIQKELFHKAPSRPGILSYAPDPEEMDKDNEKTLGGLKPNDIWLSEDQLLVLRGGRLPDHGSRHGTDGPALPVIDDYVAPPRQVKIPLNPEVPPPFPVRLSDDGPLVFLTPNGSIPAPPLPGFPPGTGYGAFPPEAFPYPPPYPPPSAGADPGNFTAGRAPFPIAPFPYIPGNANQGPFPFAGPLTDGLPPGAAFLPPPPPRGNLSDLYDEDDPSIYYPPPYSFSYKVDNSSKIVPGPLVPGIILPPPPDFFAPLEPAAPSTTNRPTAHAYPPTSGAPPTAVLRPRPPQRPPPTYLPVARPQTIVSNRPDNNINVVSTPPTKTVTFAPRPVYKKPTKVVLIPKPTPPRKPYTTSPPATTDAPVPVKPIEKKRPSVTIIQKPTKTTLKPVSGSLYDYPEKNYFEGNSVSPSPQPFLVYGPPENSRVQQYSDKGYITSTPVPLRAYYSNTNYEDLLAQIQFARANNPNTRIRPEYYNPKQNGKSVASFYFYEEPVTKAAVTTPAPQPYYDGRDYYQTVGENGQVIQDGYYYNTGSQGNFATSSNLEFRPIPSREPSPFFFVPQRQGSRTLTQEYFSINQKPKTQNTYIQQQQPIQQALQQTVNRPSSFYDQLANIQQTIDYYTTHRPRANQYQQNGYREVRQKVKPTPRPVYQFSYQNNNGHQEQNTFRAPKMDPEPFRPMVTYSKPYNVESEYSTTPQSVPIENQVVSTEISQPSKYYSTAKPEDYDYVDASHKQNVERATARPSVVTPNPIKPSRFRNGPTTKNPVNHAYYTKQEESLFDDITKNYFTIFGQKIENGQRDNHGIAVTSPIRPTETSTIKTPLNNNINIQYANEEETNTYRTEPKPISLLGDTEVNYRQPRPLINPESEFIPIVNPEIQAKYEAEQQLKQLRDQLYHKPRTHNVEIIKSEPINQPIRDGHQFARDQLDYYRRPVQGNQQVQVQNVNGGYNPRPQVAEGRPGSLVAYRLPGEGAHVYFLTPQPARPENFKYRTAEEIATLS